MGFLYPESTAPPARDCMMPTDTSRRRTTGVKSSAKGFTRDNQTTTTHQRF